MINWQKLNFTYIDQGFLLSRFFVDHSWRYLKPYTTWPCPGSAILHLLPSPLDPCLWHPPHRPLAVPFLGPHPCSLLPGTASLLHQPSSGLPFPRTPSLTTPITSISACAIQARAGCVSFHKVLSWFPGQLSSLPTLDWQFLQNRAWTWSFSCISQSHQIVPGVWRISNIPRLSNGLGHMIALSLTHC